MNRFIILHSQPLVKGESKLDKYIIKWSGQLLCEKISHVDHVP